MRAIFLTRGLITTVNDEDYDWLSQWKWCAVCCDGRFYAARGERREGKTRMLLMHREIAGRAGLPGTAQIDHHDVNTLNNLRNNLRRATQTQNNANKSIKLGSASGYKGIYLCADTQRWRARVVVSDTCYCLGRFSTSEEAARAYDAAAKKYFGEFARLNFPETNN